jgi:metal-responsive CopG/Arc/MetJ family transcriptional regulator
MTNKSHKIIARISENQQKWITEMIIQEQRNKSEILRDALNLYLVEKANRHEKKERED